MGFDGLRRCAGLSSSDALSRGSDGILATSLSFARPFHSLKVISQLISQLRNECTGLPNGTRVPKSGFAIEKLSAEWGFGCKNWEFLRFGISQPFRSCEMRVTVLRNGTRVPKLRNEVHCAAKWHSCAKSWFRNCEIPCKMELWLRNWDFSRFGTSQPFCSCEMRAHVLRSGTRVPNLVSQL
uniref:Uncharacterized protein n=1 Tax=Vitis vinifera TaxID=29760 RepID=A5C9K0_VITVI|nr:hypothetical protein VITISV_000788 [Vitis vinifera]